MDDQFRGELGSDCRSRWARFLIVPAFGSSAEGDLFRFADLVADSVTVLLTVSDCVLLFLAANFALLFLFHFLCFSLHSSSFVLFASLCAFSLAKHTQADTNANKHTQNTQTHTNTNKHTQTHTNTHKHTQTHTNAHKHTQSQAG